MALTSTVRDQVATYKGSLLAYLSVHTADPGTTGTSEATGGSYARQQNSWGAVSGGSIVGTGKTFTPGAGTFTYGGYWSAATGGTFLGGFAITSKTLGAGDTLTITPTVTQTES
jgi:hypothetical protein